MAMFDLSSQSFFMMDKAIHLGGNSQIETGTFASQSGMILMVMGLEAADWSEPVKGLGGSSFRSWTVLMAQGFIQTGGSFCSSSSLLQGHNLCWTGKDPAGSLFLSICLWISFYISPLSLSCGFECWCLFGLHISACLKKDWTGFLTFMHRRRVQSVSRTT